MHGAQRGQALLETAVTLPLLLLVLFGLFEFGRIGQVISTLNQGAEAAARYGGVHPSDLTGIQAALITPAAAGSVRVTSGQITISYYDPSDSVMVGSYVGGTYTSTSQCSSLVVAALCAGPVAGDHIQVQVDVPWAANDPIIGPMLPGLILHGSSTYLIEQ